MAITASAITLQDTPRHSKHCWPIMTFREIHESWPVSRLESGAFQFLWVESGRGKICWTYYGSARIGSGQEVFEIPRVGSGRVTLTELIKTTDRTHQEPWRRWLQQPYHNNARSPPIPDTCINSFTRVSYLKSLALCCAIAVSGQDLNHQQLIVTIFHYKY